MTRGLDRKVGGGATAGAGEAGRGARGAAAKFARWTGIHICILHTVETSSVLEVVQDTQ